MMQPCYLLGTVSATRTLLIGRVAQEGPGSRLLRSSAQVGTKVAPSNEAYWKLSYGVLRGTAFESRVTLSYSRTGFTEGINTTEYAQDISFNHGEYIAFKVEQVGQAVPLESLCILPEFDMNLEFPPQSLRVR